MAPRATRRLLCLLLLLGAAPAGAQERALMVPVWADGRDAWTLLDRNLANRQLALQLGAPPQAFRLCHACVPALAAADTSVGAQVVTAGIEQTRFHGFFVADTFTAAQPLESLDVALNLTILNPSASDGYRVSHQLLPGFALHLQHDVVRLRGEPVRVHFVASDLDLVTLGRGLLVEEIPLEGHMAGLEWNGFSLRETFAGRVFWDDDDLLSLSLGALGRGVELTYTAWMFDLSASAESRHVVSYLGLAFELIPWHFLRLAAEYGLRLDAEPRHAALARVDYLALVRRAVELHAGAQLRLYQRGFGPGGGNSAPTTLPRLPFREQSYATNSLELFGATHRFDQLSGTAMLELRAPAAAPLRLFVNVEWWGRWLYAEAGDEAPLVLPRGHVGPGYFDDVFYSVGVELRPWWPLPHRARVLLTNKQVTGGPSVLAPDPARFVSDPVVLLTAACFL